MRLYGACAKKRKKSGESRGVRPTLKTYVACGGRMCEVGRTGMVLRAERKTPQGGSRQTVPGDLPQAARLTSRRRDRSGRRGEWCAGDTGAPPVASKGVRSTGAY